MKIQMIIILSCLLSCSSLTHKRSHDPEICKENIIIEHTEVISEIESLLLNPDFYNDSVNQYFMFEIKLDDKLGIKNVRMIFENNPQYSDQIQELIMKLSFRKVDDKKKCKEYALPFIVNARLKKLLYPKDKTFYDVDLPIE